MKERLDGRRWVTASLVAALLLPVASPAQQDTTRRWEFEITPDGAGFDLSLVERERPEPGPGEVLVRVRATSLNARDVYMLEASSSSRSGLAGGIPLSDGAGDVVAVGPGVTRFEVGDRVAGTFFEHWTGGDRTAEANASARGGTPNGMLAEHVLSSEDGLIAIPESLSYEEAATLPCAGLTAWVSLFKHGNLKPGDYVLLEGTGGVSSFGLLFAAAAGAQPIVTSSSDEKLARAVELGAVGTVNYREHAQWHDDVRALTGDVGVKHVLDIGGEQTVPQALRALGYGGHLALIGGLTGFDVSVPRSALFPRGLSATGIYVGSRDDFEAMNAFIAEHDIHPLIDRVFEFEQAPAAFRYMRNGDYMGKIVIRH
jgi:NADPH:quinone reductase-like Zn-dependent oxidoreductase